MSGRALTGIISLRRRSLTGILGAAAIAMSVGGCAGEREERWSTRGDSVLGQPSLAAVNGLGERIPVAAGEASEARDASISLLKQAAESTNPLLRANAIEALHPVPEHLKPILQQALADENRGVRFTAAMTVGQLELASLVPVVYPLLHDPSDSVRAAAIFALRANGESVDPSPLGRMIMSDDPEVKANAAMAIAELGNRSAVPMLRNAVGRDQSGHSPERAQLVDLQLAEAMVRLGARDEIEVIRAALFAPPERGEMVALACMTAGRLRDTSVMPRLLDLATREGRRRLPAEIRMAATLAAAQIEPMAAPVDVPITFAASERFELRAQAAFTLGKIPGQASLNVLRQLLHDENPLVQVAAAGGILRHSA